MRDAAIQKIDERLNAGKFPEAAQAVHVAEELLADIKHACDKLIKNPLKKLLFLNFNNKPKTEAKNMVEFQTIKAEELKFGNNNFIEVARKKAIAENGENEFISVSRGFYGQDGSKRFTKSFAVPLDQNVIDFVAKTLKEV